MNPPAKCGDKFGDWTVLKRFIGNKKGPYCKCKCTCGRECYIGEQVLRLGKFKRCKHCSNISLHYKHGLSYEKTYYKWNNIMQCCYNPKFSSFHLYGGRGIKMCDEWLNVTNFYDYMGDMPQGNTLRRIDPDANFEPGNCIWVSK